MKAFNLLLLSILIFTAISCSKPEKNYTVETVNGIKTYKNKNIPADPKFKIETKELFTILGDQEGQDSTINFANSRSLTVDKQGNIYVLIPKTANVLKFDAKGKHIKTFGGIGQGPGEMTEPRNFAIMSDTLFVFDYAIHQTNLFDLDGNFIRSTVIASNAFFYYINKVDEDKFVGIVALDRWDNDKVYTVYQVVTYKKNSTPLNVLHSRDEILQPPREVFMPWNYMSPYAVGKDKIYILQNSTDSYKIYVFDFSGKHLYNFTKQYSRLPLSAEELAEFTDTQYNPAVESKPEFDYKYKNVANVYGLNVTKDGYLLVQSAQNRNTTNKYDYTVDAFKDSVYINTFKMDLGKGYDFYNSAQVRYFIDDKIYFIDKDKNSLQVLTY